MTKDTWIAVGASVPVTLVVCVLYTFLQPMVEQWRDTLGIVRSKASLERLGRQYRQALFYCLHPGRFTHHLLAVAIICIAFGAGFVACVIIGTVIGFRTDLYPKPSEGLTQLEHLSLGMFIMALCSELLFFGYAIRTTALAFRVQRFREYALKIPAELRDMEAEGNLPVDVPREVYKWFSKSSKE